MLITVKNSHSHNFLTFFAAHTKETPKYVIEALSVAMVLVYIYTASLCGVEPEFGVPILSFLFLGQCYVIFTAFTDLNYLLFHLISRLSELLVHRKYPRNATTSKFFIAMATK